MKQNFSKQEVDYTQIKNSILTNEKLSLKAKGLFAYLYSKSNDWDFSHKRIALEMKESSNTIANILRELEEYGYLERKRLHTGRMEYFITYEPHTKKPHTKKAKVAKSQGGKVGTVSNIEVNSNTNVNNNIDIAKTSFANETNKVLDIFYKYNPVINFGNKTQRNAVDFFIKKYGVDNTIKMVKTALQVQSEQFCPVITTPVQLKNKFGDLRVFLDRKKKAEEVQEIPEF